MMKIPCFLAFFLIIFSVGLYADQNFGMGVGVEVNGYSQRGVGIGGMGGLDYRFGEMFSFGVRGLYSFDLAADDLPMSIMEFTGNVRWYFLRFPRLLTYYYLLQGKYHAFAQFEAGGALVYMGNEDSIAVSGFSWGASVGLRIMLVDWKGLYVEPYLRYSSTGTFGIGAMIGWVFRPYGY
jgi:hypothetical protein